MWIFLSGSKEVKCFLISSNTRTHCQMNRTLSDDNISSFTISFVQSTKILLHYDCNYILVLSRVIRASKKIWDYTSEQSPPCNSVANFYSLLTAALQQIKQNNNINRPAVILHRPYTVSGPSVRRHVYSLLWRRNHGERRWKYSTRFRIDPYFSQLPSASGR